MNPLLTTLLAALILSLGTQASAATTQCSAKTFADTAQTTLFAKDEKKKKKGEEDEEPDCE